MIRFSVVTWGLQSHLVSSLSSFSIQTWKSLRSSLTLEVKYNLEIVVYLSTIQQNILMKTEEEIRGYNNLLGLLYPPCFPVKRRRVKVGDTKTTV